MNSDFKELLKNFLDLQIKFLVVGGVAVIKYTEPRYTKHLDMWIECSEQNSALVFLNL
ncbi:MAG: hypothetical protein SGJ02_02410 [bacterium]|nr:hypothetical protein [bacterium]